MLVKKEVDIILVTIFIAVSFSFGVYLNNLEIKGEKLFSEAPLIIKPLVEIPLIPRENEKLSPEPQIEEKEFFVYLNNTKYNPDYLEIPVDSKVTWINVDRNRVYRVYERTVNGRFNIFLDRNSNFSFVFNEPGTYYFNDAVFTYMHGIIKIR